MKRITLVSVGSHRLTYKWLGWREVLAFRRIPGGWRFGEAWVALALVALAVAWLSAGCGWSKQTLWPTTVQCASQTASDQLFSDVRALTEADGFSTEFSDSARRGLDDLALSYGAAAVACVLHALIDKYTPRGAQAAMDEGRYQEARQSERITRFLGERNVEVSK